MLNVHVCNVNKWSQFRQSTPYFIQQSIPRAFAGVALASTANAAPEILTYHALIHILCHFRCAFTPYAAGCVV